ncbi:MAG: type II toxin-antitoxin system VapC family toxin [Phycisphaerae bacterium]|nr:type II toxin-antitoxin system VapC family toxin [Phycisphaerae bacterium]
MSIIVDASVTLAWCLEDETSSYASQVLGRLTHADARVPSIWALEVANALLVAERRGRLAQNETAAVLSLLRGLPIRIDTTPPEVVFADVIPLGRTHLLSAYDAAYLELAIRTGSPIATLDEALRRAAGRVDVDVIEV